MKNKLVILVGIILVMLVVLPACNSKVAGPLPRSMKGYELYSWQEGGQWHFTLITGTNRNKTITEVVTGETKEGEDGWVNIHATGVEAIKAVLSRVPAKEFVSWSGRGTVGPPAEGEELTIRLELPPTDIINQIKEHAEQLGLDFNVF